MVKFIISLVLSGLAVWIAAELTPGVAISGLWAGIVVAVVLGLVNATVWFLLRVLTFPINFLTFGLISWIITILMVLLTDNLVDGFSVERWYYAAIFAMLLGLINGLLTTGETKYSKSTKYWQ
jgi:putative membrane protein